MSNRSEIGELTRINAIIAPWLPVNVEREAWLVTLRTGTQVVVACPVGAAADVERAGHMIKAHP